MSGMLAASSLNVRRSLLFPLPHPDPERRPLGGGKRNENFRLFGVSGVRGDSGGVAESRSFMLLAVSSLAKAIASSNVRSSAADIGLTCNNFDTFNMVIDV